MFNVNLASFAQRTAYGLLVAVILAGSTAGMAFAWATPQLNALCAPNATNFSWSINLPWEEDQIIEFSWDNFNHVAWTRDFETWGTHTFTSARDGAVLSVRYASDHRAKTSRTANSQLCVQPTPTPSPKSTPTPTPSPSPTPKPTPTPTPTPRPTPTPTPKPTPSPTPKPSPTPSPSPKPTPSPTPKPTPSPTPSPTPTPEVKVLRKELSVRKTDNHDITRPGHTLTYVVTVENTGEIDIRDLEVMDTLPAQVTVKNISDGGKQSGTTITWQGISLDAVSTKTFKYTVQVKNDTADKKVICNLVSAKSNDHDLSESTKDCTTVKVLPQVAGTKVSVPITAKTGAGAVGLISTLLGGSGLLAIVRRTRRGR